MNVIVHRTIRRPERGSFSYRFAPPPRIDWEAAENAPDLRRVIDDIPETPRRVAEQVIAGGVRTSWDSRHSAPYGVLTVDVVSPQRDAARRVLCVAGLQRFETVSVGISGHTIVGAVDIPVDEAIVESNPWPEEVYKNDLDWHAPSAIRRGAWYWVRPGERLDPRLGVPYRVATTGRDRRWQVTIRDTVGHLLPADGLVRIPRRAAVELALATLAVEYGGNIVHIGHALRVLETARLPIRIRRSVREWRDRIPGVNEGRGYRVREVELVATLPGVFENYRVVERTVFDRRNIPGREHRRNRITHGEFHHRWYEALESLRATVTREEYHRVLFGGHLDEASALREPYEGGAPTYDYARLVHAAWAICEHLGVD